MIRDRIIVGMRDEKLSEGLQTDSQINLKTVIKITKASELIKHQPEMLTKVGREEHEGCTNGKHEEKGKQESNEFSR